MAPQDSHDPLLKEATHAGRPDAPYSSLASSSLSSSPFPLTPPVRDSCDGDFSDTCSERGLSGAPCGECLMGTAEALTPAASTSVTSPFVVSIAALPPEISNTGASPSVTSLSVASISVSSTTVASLCVTLTAVASPSVASILVHSAASSPCTLLGDLARVAASPMKTLGPALTSKEEATARRDTREAWPSGRCAPRCRMSLGGASRSPLAALLLLLHSFLLLSLLPHAAAFDIGE
ncbi:uncharacterized protein LOC127001552 [Eriocheir sinensis]|uniref:uncharacterized protein LOC127001552 n=1 Tax=Eriocheir sinensis TaxID=95602 RepID=UPI0021C74114|nr:uncharacterized protein LOC127001552 [Eriocheir sinensis]